jgi:hypothetical protein
MLKELHLITKLQDIITKKTYCYQRLREMKTAVTFKARSVLL